MALYANKNTNHTRVIEKLHWQQNAYEKIAIIIYHEKGHSKRNTAAKFKIEPKQLCDWLSKKQQLLKVQSDVKKLNTSSSLTYLALEAILLEWIKERRNNQQAILQSMIQMKAKLFA